MTSDPSACANMNIRRAARQIGKFFDERMAGSDIRATQFSLLVLVDRHAPAPISYIAEAIRMERTTLTRNLNVLERQGLVEVQAGTDARMRLYSLTDQGKKAVQDTQLLWSEAQSDFLSRFGERRWEALRAELKALEACL